MCRENVAQIRTVDDVFEGRKNTDPDSGAVIGGNIPAIAKSVWLCGGLCHAMPTTANCATAPVSRRFRPGATKRGAIRKTEDNLLATRE